MQRVLLWIVVLAAVALTAIGLLPEREPDPIKVAILHSLTGTMAISETPVMEATLLAIEQLNTQGGLLGRRVTAVVVDGQSDPRIFAREAERLISQEGVSVIFGCWTSACRKSVKPIVERDHGLLFYPVQYEGLESSPNIIYTGAAPNQQLIPAVNWALKEFGSSLYLVGSDYIFPRIANWLIKRQVQLLHGEVVSERYIMLGSRDFSAVVADIKQRRPSVVINTINGDSNIAFFHTLQTAGITADDIPVLSLSVGEAEVAKMGGAGVGHYAAWNYLQRIDSSHNRAFISAFRSRFGHNRVVTDPMEAAWIGVHLWAQAVQIAQSDETAVVQQVIAHQSMHAPEGIVAVDHKTHHLWKRVRIGKVKHDGQFSLEWISPSTVRPTPFPALVNRREAERYMQHLYTNWNHHWAPQPVAIE
ncbi:MAG: urea ABC transporter substrate-binding protein [Mariprofundales bacterium]|nr:urea ABC transporter substrate-binding protein [Mariprofundales bacterium]